MVEGDLTEEEGVLNLGFESQLQEKLGNRMCKNVGTGEKLGFLEWKEG